MRWFWIDRYTEFESGRRATAVKNVSLAEDHLHDHFPAAPVMPNSLIIEGIAQTAGLLVGEHNGFERQVILAKISKVKFYCAAMPGDTLTYRTVVEDIREHGAAVSCTSHIGNRLQAECDIYFAHLDEREEKIPLFKPEQFLNWLRLVKMYEVGVAADGSPLKLPPALAEIDDEQAESVNSA